MRLKARSIIRLAISRLVHMAACLCVFTLLPIPQVAALAWAESVETEYPCKEGGKESEKLLSNWRSAHGRLKDRRHRFSNRPAEEGNERQPIVSSAARVLAITGHHFANGLCAPLLV